MKTILAVIVFAILIAGCSVDVTQGPSYEVKHLPKEKKICTNTKIATDLHRIECKYKFKTHVFYGAKHYGLSSIVVK